MGPATTGTTGPGTCLVLISHLYLGSTCSSLYCTTAYCWDTIFSHSYCTPTAVLRFWEDCHLCIYYLPFSTAASGTLLLLHSLRYCRLLQDYTHVAPGTLHYFLPGFSLCYYFSLRTLGWDLLPTSNSSLSPGRIHGTLPAAHRTILTASYSWDRHLCLTPPTLPFLYLGWAMGHLVSGTGTLHFSIT